MSDAPAGSLNWALASFTRRELLAQPSHRTQLAQELKRRYETGVRPSRLARAFQLDVATVWHLLNEAETEFTHGHTLYSGKPAAPRPYTDAELRSAYEAGAGIKTLAEMWDTPYSTVRNDLLAAGATLRPRSAHQSTPATSEQMRGFELAVGTQVRHHREQIGWDRQQMSAALAHAVSKQTIASHELGGRGLTVARLLQYSTALGISPADIIAAAESQVMPVEHNDVDLAKLAATTDEVLAPARAWAALTLASQPREALGVMRIERPALDQLAALCGVTPTKLSLALAANVAPDQTRSS